VKGWLEAPYLNSRRDKTVSMRAGIPKGKTVREQMAPARTSPHKRRLIAYMPPIMATTAVG
jgi:hypothetical protein